MIQTCCTPAAGLPVTLARNTMSVPCPAAVIPLIDGAADRAGRGAAAVRPASKEL